MSEASFNLDCIETIFQTVANLAAEQTLPRFKQRIAADNKLGEGFDPVTEADKEAERVIREYLSREFPDHGIIGEEFANTHAQSAYQWVIDPIDGTRAYISGIPLWGTLVGLLKNEKPIVGMMDQPFTKEQFFCTGEASYYCHDKTRTEIKTS